MLNSEYWHSSNFVMHRLKWKIIRCHWFQTSCNCYRNRSIIRLFLRVAKPPGTVTFPKDDMNIYIYIDTIFLVIIEVSWILGEHLIICYWLITANSIPRILLSRHMKFFGEILREICMPKYVYIYIE